MKVRIRYSNTQKFIVTLQQSEPSYADLKERITSFISDNYGEQITNVVLSFNGTDAITCNDSDSLQSLTIVSGDLLTVLRDQPQESHHVSEEESATPSFQSKSKPSESASAAYSKPSEKTTPQMDKPKSDASEGSGNVLGSNKAYKVTNLLEAKDGEPPPIVEEIFRQYSPSSASNALNLLIHIVMLESGFYIQDGHYSREKTLPLSWKEMVATIKYHHPGFNSFDCTIVIVTMGNIKQVLASFEGQETEISVRLDIKYYFHSEQILPHRLTKLSHLARVLKNQLLYPLQVAAHETLGLPAPWHLAGLPQEVLIIIGTFLDLKSVLRMAASCKSLHASCCDNKLWFLLFKRDFKSLSHSSDKISGADWKAKYKDAYLRKIEYERQKEKSHDYVLPERDPFHPIPFPNPHPDIDPNNPYMPQPWGPSPYYPPQPDPQPNPFWDPDSPYFGGEIPSPRGPYFPSHPNPLDPYGRRMRPRRPFNPLHPPFLPPRYGGPSGPRFL